LVETTGGLISTAEAVAQGVRSQLGLEVHPLAYLGRRILPGGGGFEALVLAENLAPARPALNGARQAGPETLEALARENSERGAWVRGWLDEQRAGAAPAARVPWARPGWRAEATRWIEGQLEAKGERLIGPVEVRRTWSLSCLLKLQTTAGVFYFKAVPPLFAQEPRLTRYLAERFAGRVPAVMAVDVERRWLLMHEFAGRQVQETDDLKTWAGALRGYAEMQRALVGQADELLRLGCPDRRLARLAEAAPRVLAGREALLIGERRGLTSEEVEALEGLLPRLQRGCKALEALGPPPTLEHGDLHGGNIVISPAGDYRYYDWTDGCLAHPYMCLAAFLEPAPEAWHADLCGAYLAGWREFADEATLMAALGLARPLSALHMALSYCDIWEQTEPGQRWPLAGAVPYFLREVLKHGQGVET
jgi:hypothetical protein